MYDVVVIGGGINGCSIAYELTQSGQSVAIVDMDSIAAGGSGAAGAFISPKFSKAGELKELLHEAFIYSMEFYQQNFPQFFIKSLLLHIAKDKDSSQILQSYKKKTDLELLTLSSDFLSTVTTEALEQENISIEAGLVDAEAMCNALCQKSTFINEKVEKLAYENGTWHINDSIRAKKVVLATGAYQKIIDEPYIKLRGVWGHRIDVKTSSLNPNSIHQFVSMSPSSDGVIAIGATHNVHYHPQTTSEIYNYKEGREELLEKASRTIVLKDIEVIKDYTGLRSGSFDYIPMIGKLVDSQKTLANKNIRFQVKKLDIKEYSYYPNLYMINGSGGYGFVFAPFLAKQLRDNILEEKEISPRLQPARFFSRWARKL